jgi:hypothetical protein
MAGLRIVGPDSRAGTCRTGVTGDKVVTVLRYRDLHEVASVGTVRTAGQPPSPPLHGRCGSGALHAILGARSS